MAKDKAWMLFLLAAILHASTLPAQERVVFPVAASTKTTGYTPLWAALKQGFFAQQGLDVQPIVIRGSDRAIQALKELKEGR
jgi:ABC-type nitrate/sulfonate/bicarbonate transport system substrate-binding protein